MTSKVSYLKLLRLGPLFKSESDANLLENVRFFPICNLFVIQRDKFQITRIFLISTDETMTSIFRKDSRSRQDHLQFLSLLVNLIQEHSTRGG